TAPMYSDLWITEELSAHSIELGVLDHETGGGYRKLLNQIASPEADSVEKFLGSVTRDQVIALDSLFTVSSRQEANLRSAQYMTDLGRVWIGKHYPAAEVPAREWALYRTIATH